MVIRRASKALIVGVTALLWSSFGQTASGTDNASNADVVAKVQARLQAITDHRFYRHWTGVDERVALEQAAAATQGSLHGSVIAVKDNIDLSWLATAAGASVLAERRPARNATVVDRLLAAGAIIPGHTNMDTWARGVRSVSQTTGATANAHNAAYGPMGSSGGSAVAVALGEADAALGTDTCGSLRYPAAANLVLGLRPTPGLVSRSGVVPLSPTQDVVGPIAIDPNTLAAMLDVIAGSDPRDPLTATAPLRDHTYTDFLIAAQRQPRTWRVGVVRSLGAYRSDASGATMLDRLSNAGIQLVDVTLPVLADANVINDESAATRRLVLANTDEREWLAEPLVVTDRESYRRRIARRRTNATALIALMDRQNLDALVYPTTPFLPSLRGAAQPSGNCHVSATSGLPALAVPHGLDQRGVPVSGIDLLARPFAEDQLLALAQTLMASRGP
jgi:amidase